ncbi:TonB-dependent receptor domain-containing protein [Oscillatoria salina]|uniref:TonB-dependent receptor domain-containing protein n=1 Tax=Oscillatoria salina TaxID=331517 RepID=UPI001CCAD4D1|nr:TonB-dependent receptor [Oscillatoria salina]MBZ8182857.1 TonB-dependent receptor [Oscillatoria salina IIICB1]
MKNLHLLHSLWLAPAIAVVCIQNTLAQVIDITNVRINPTPEGLEIIFDGNIDRNLEVNQRVEDNRLILTINNARLVGETIEIDNPTPGLDFLRVISTTENSIQAIVTGDTKAPTVDTIQTEGQLSINIVVPRIAEEEVEIIELVVTAEKFAENIQDVPLSITAFSQGEIEDANLDSLDSVANNTPNFSFFSAGGQSRFFSTYTMRGLSNNNFLSRDTVGFFVDDIPYDYTGFLDIDLTDVERIEVLRGPQNTLYGRNAQAGVVNIITREPSNTFEGQLSARYGSFDERSGTIAISGPLEPEILFFRLSGRLEARDGYITNTLTDEVIGSTSGGNIRGKLLWLPSEDWEIAFNSSYQDYNNGDPTFQLIGQSDLFAVNQDFIGFNRINSNDQSLKITYDNDNIQATSITTRRYSNQEVETEADFSPVDLFTGISDVNSTIWTQEVRLQSSEEAENLQWLVGGYFESRLFNVEADGLRYGTVGAQTLGLQPGLDRTSAELDQTTFALFGQASYEPIEALTLTAGLRYDTTNIRMDRRRNYEVDGSSVEIPFGMTFDDVETDSSALLPRFVIEYEFNPSALVYGSITQGYKPAGLNFRAESDDVLVIGEERSWNYEIGVKTSWLDNRLIANLAVFYNSIDDFQVALQDQRGFIANVANAEASIFGVELELKAQPVDGLDLIAGFGYTEATFDRFFNPFTGQTLDGNRLPFAPEFTINFAAQYRAPWGLFARVGLNTLGSYFTEESNSIFQGTVTTVDATLGYELDNYGIYLVANNIFDTRYLTSGLILPGGNVGSYNDPFTIGVLLKASF